MIYDIRKTNIFDEWLDSVKSVQYRARIAQRFDRIELGNFGDHKRIDNNLFELRFFFGSGYRVYYTIKEDTVVLLLCGGDKASQKNDIVKAKEIQQALE